MGRKDIADSLRRELPPHLATAATARVEPDQLSE